MNIIDEINNLKVEKKAVVLAHNYQLPEIQDIADFVGDSLELSRTAANTDAKIIVFCGVYFMAETAKILSPLKTVILPDLKSGCPLADMVTVEDIKKLRSENPSAAVVCYINTSADVKAECDICCTSSNAADIVNSVSADEVIFLPDRNLGNYVSKYTKKKIILWNGFCLTHELLKAEEVLELKKQFSAEDNVKFVAHPECTEDVLKLADKVTSTSGILKYVKAEPSKNFIIGTETAIIHRLKKENPDKNFIPASRKMFCQNMKYNNLELLYEALSNEQPEIEIPEKIRKKAFEVIDRMLKIGKKD
ncbi:MAG: quinolinate synthase NadA [Elusimicrobia bacterium]|nr:quinolinate synthase NadA [Elusimicrobiota bacterium]